MQEHHTIAVIVGCQEQSSLADNIAPAWACAITRLCKDAPAGQAFNTYM